MRTSFLRSIFLGSCISTLALIHSANAGPCILVSCSDDTAKTVNNVRVVPLSMTTQVDGGQLVHGHIDTKSNVEGLVLQRLSVWLTQEAVVNERLDIKVGVGGIFFYSIPGGDVGDADGAHKTLTKFGPGIGRADMTYHFGSLERPPVSLQMGYFPYKYNPDAKNLGEYLLRSGTYPGTLTTGGWNIVSEASYMMQGIRLNVSLWNGKFQSDFLLPMERDLPPMSDISPTYVASLNPVAGVEIGGGIACNHCISVKPSLTSPEKIVKGGGSDPNGIPGNGYVIPNPNFKPDSSVTAITGSNPRYIYDSANFYTFQGLKLMGRASFDPKAYLPQLSMLASQDLKVYAEFAVLGVKNYPFYYTDIYQRMPVTVGFNVPTFKLLDALNFEMEYYNSKFPNSLNDPVWGQIPIPDMVDKNDLPTQDPNLYDPSASSIKRDNWHWSVYAKKEVMKGMRFYAQVANDHLRVPQFDFRPSWTEITDRNGKDWYYLVRFELGI